MNSALAPSPPPPTPFDDIDYTGEPVDWGPECPAFTECRLEQGNDNQAIRQWHVRKWHEWMNEWMKWMMIYDETYHLISSRTNVCWLVNNSCFASRTLVLVHRGRVCGWRWMYGIWPMYSEYLCGIYGWYQSIASNVSVMPFTHSSITTQAQNIYNEPTTGTHKHKPVCIRSTTRWE